MQNLIANFSNSGDIEYNDVLFNHPAFQVSAGNYSFELQPKTKFWRFGILLSKIPEFEFEPPKSRYNNKEIKHIQINIGERIKKEWHRPNRLEFAVNNIEKPILHRFEKYRQLSSVTLRLEYKVAEKIFLVSYRAEPNEFYEAKLVLPGYQYFKIAAWADSLPFELGCNITIGESVPVAAPTVSNSLSSVAYWILKIRDQTWDIRQFREGQETWFNSYNLNSVKREEYETLLSVKPGDKVLGYVFDTTTAFACVMQVTKEIHPHEGRGENISMKIIQMLNPFQPLINLKPSNSVRKELEQENERRWFSISEEEYNLILQSKHTPEIEQWIPNYTAEGNHLTTDDQLEFIHDIRSFATVISLKEVKPPLAIGLFGNWGAGKSFFMENLMQEINKLKGSHEQYVEKVVQVTFNSWHYSDSNLWASLITEIFDKLHEFSKSEGKQDELEKLSQALQITVMQKEITEAKKKELEGKHAKLESEQLQKRARLKDISGLNLLKLILEDPKVQDDLKSLNNEHVEEIFTNKAKVEEYLHEVAKAKNKLVYFFKIFFDLKGRWWIAIIFSFFVFIVCWLVDNVAFFGKTWNSFTARLSGAVLFITTLIGNAIHSYTPMKEQFKMAYERLLSLKNTIDSRPLPISPELASTQNELQSIKVSLENLDHEIKRIEIELHEIRSGKKLLEFIEQRSRNEEYSKNLGLISWIRKDFKKLDELLRKQHLLSAGAKKNLNPTNVHIKIDRIILYIDDLDRCNEEIVVRVLEAVHLLLAFELFVVVVGVDPRWLNQALDKKYPFLGDKTSTVSSFDYLEKIFQIPFSLKTISRKGREDLLAYLIRNEMEEIKPPDDVEQNQIEKKEVNFIQLDDHSLSNSANKEIINPTADDEPPMHAQAAPKLTQKQLKFSNTELSFMKDISGLFGHTPRTIKRFINIYRIVKAHKKFEAGREPLPTLLVLAIVVGCPDHAQVFIQELQKSGEQRLPHFLDNTLELQTLKVWIMKRLKEELLETVSTSSMKPNLELVSRFSFRTLPG